MRGDLSVDHGHLMNSDPRLFLNLASQLLSALLTLEFLDAGCNRWPAEPVVRHGVDIIGGIGSAIVLKDRALDVTCKLDVVVVDAAVKKDASKHVFALLGKVQK